MIILSRLVTALILGIAAYQVGNSSDLQKRLPDSAEIALNFGVLMLIGVIVGWVLGGLLGKLLQRMLARFSERTSDRSGAELLVGAIGLVVGLAVAALVSLPLLQLKPFGTYLVLPMTLVIGYAAAELAAARHAEILRLFGASVGTGEAPAKLLDTSALIDGRIADVAAAGFVEGQLIVPVFVLEELQHIADSSDALRRARGKRGLDVVSRLRKTRTLQTTDEDPTDIAAVDSKLVRLATQHGWSIVTTDFNLNKVASIQSVRVLNVNDLANALKPEFVAGETVTIKVMREGKGEGQGVGYLDDGTMVIVEQGADQIGSTLEVEVTSVLQSSSGRLVFTKLADAAETR